MHELINQKNLHTKMRAVVALLLACIVLGSEAEEALQFPKYRDACPGYVSETNKEFRQFIDGVLSGNETSLMTVCKKEYFTSLPDTCSEEHKECVVGIVLCSRNGIGCCSGVYVESLPLETSVLRQCERPLVRLLPGGGVPRAGF